VSDTRPGRAGSPVPSPCIGICRMDPATKLCEGCQRTIDEIANWSTGSDEWKRAVWDEIARRSGFAE
jgi:uncharacterized protein